MTMSNAEVQAVPLNQVRDAVGKLDQVAKVSGAAAAASAGLKAQTAEAVSATSPAVRAELQEAVGVANEKLLQRGQKLDIGVDEESGTIVIRVSDQKTGEMIRQMPSEEALRITRSIDRLTGILVDQKE
jgi:flagellar protein FlaG